MRVRSVRWATVLVVVLIAVAVPAAAAGPSSQESAGGAALTSNASISDATVASAQSTELRLVQELKLTPERPGEIHVRLRYDVPDRVTAIVAGLPSEASVISTDGFRSGEGREYDWDGRTASPSITYRLPTNQTGEVRGPEGADGRYLFVDVGEWALIERPQVSTSWRWTGSGRVELSRNATVDGPGAVGGSTAFLGEHRELRTAAHGQTFRLIVPAAADLEESPEAVLSAFETAADALRVGTRDETVFVAVAPSGSVEWSARGLQVGDADLWVQDDERLDDPGDTWTHEYVHTRQSFRTTPTSAWITEAMATYYAALLAVEDGRVSFDAFERWLSLGTRSPYRDTVLADPTSWGGIRPDYYKGALVLGEIDRQLRLRTEHERTLQSLFRSLNERDDPVDGPAVLDLLESFGGEDVRRSSEQYVTTEAVPDTWSRAAHGEAFGPSASLIDVALEDRYRIGGPFRNGSASDTPIVLAVGETLSLDARVQNIGGTSGTYEVAFRVDDVVESQRTGRLDPNESTTLTFDRSFDDPGRYSVAAGTERVRVDVVRPATAHVVDVRASRRTVPVGETVTVSATVRNTATVPGERALTLERDGEVLADRTVRLAPGESRTVSFSTTLDSSGEHRFEVANGSVLVMAEQTTGADGDTATGAVPGDDVPVNPVPMAAVLAIAVVVLAVLLVVHRRRG